MTPGAMIGIPTYNGWRRVEDLLLNLRQRTFDIPHEIVVCDDSGRPDHREKVRDVCRAAGVRLIVNEKNRGVAASWNALVRSTDHEVAILLNDDVLVAKDWLSYLAYAIMENPGVGSFSMNCLFIRAGDVPEIVRSPDAQVIPLNVRYVGGNLIRNERFLQMPQQEDHHPGRVMCPAGCFFGFKRSTYDLVGGFDERYFAFYEETDFGVSCAVRGMPAFTLTAPFDNYHIWSATFGSAPEIDAGQVMARSRQAFVEKWRAALGIQFNDAPEIHHPIMDKIPPLRVRWLGPGKVQREELL